jgi:pimeloyl-ACP methyl ester carboxylesterase
VTTTVRIQSLKLGVLSMCALVLIAALAIVPGRASQAASRPEGAKPTIVLVHGAWADASSWAPVTQRFQDLGYNVVAPANPLVGLSTDAATLSDFLQTIPGPIVLVGHSYGGAVITNAATGNTNVKALVYVDAYIPDQGDSVFGLTAAQPGSCVGPAAFNLVPFPGAPTGDADIYLKTGPSGTYPGFATCFANGLSGREAALLAASQRPAALSAGTEPSGAPAWKQIPSWDLIGTDDHVIPPAEQLFMAHRAGAHITEVDAGHLSLISHPNAAVGIILSAVQATS